MRRTTIKNGAGCRASGAAVDQLHEHSRAARPMFGRIPYQGMVLWSDAVMKGYSAPIWKDVMLR
jgi:hypothetical protein